MPKRPDERLGRPARLTLYDQAVYFRGKAYEFEDRLAKSVERNDRLVSLLKEWVDHYRNARPRGDTLLDRTRALINHEKKD